MKTKRPAAKRRSDRRRQPEGVADRAAARRANDAPPSRRGRKRGGTAPAQTREVRAARSGPRTATTLRPDDRPAPPKNTRQAKARAQARKAKAPKVVRVPLRERLAIRLASLDLRPRTLAAKVPFVVLIIGTLGLGLGITLWLSTDAAARSYQLGKIRSENRALLQQKEALERDVLTAESAPALAEAARNLGMIPSRDTAHLVQGPDGNWVVVGSPKPAEGAPPPPLNTKLADEQTAPAPPRPNPAEVPVPAGAGGPTAVGVPGASASGPEVLLRVPNTMPMVTEPLGGQHLPNAGPTPPGPTPGMHRIGLPPGPVPTVAPPVAVPVPPGTQPAPSPASVEQFSRPTNTAPTALSDGVR